MSKALAIPLAPIIYPNAEIVGNTGFFDPTPVAPVGGNNGTTLGEQRRIALQYAAQRWADQIQGTIPMKIRAQWISVPSSNGGITLANCSAINYFRDPDQTSPLPLQNVSYPSVLADQLVGEDLELNGTSDDMTINCNSYVDNPGPFPGDLRRWYYGLDGNAPSTVNGPWIDFVGVLLHEVGHGLGFLSFLNQNGSYAAPNGAVWDVLMSNSAGTAITSLSQAQRATAAVGNNLFNNGSVTVSVNGGNRARLFAPSTFTPGSSLHHYDEATYSATGSLNELMTPNADDFPTQVFGPLCLGALRDMGYVMADTLAPVSTTNFPAHSASYKPGVIAGSSITGVATDKCAGTDNQAVGLLRVNVALQRTSDSHYYDWNAAVFSSAPFDYNTHTKKATLSNLPLATGTRNWQLEFPPGLSDGQYQVHVSAVDQLDQGSNYSTTTFTVDGASPVVSFSPLSNQQQIFQFTTTGPDAIGGNVSEPATIAFRIDEFDSAQVNTRYWNGTGWGTDPHASNVWLLATVTGNTWSPAPGVTLPGAAAMRDGPYLVHVRATDAAGNTSETNVVVVRLVNAETIKPSVSINYPLPASSIAGLDRIAGNASDPAGGTGLTGAITLSILGPDGDYWNGTEWVSSPHSISVNISAGGNWEYRSLPRGFDVRSGGYHITAQASDWAGNVSDLNSGNDFSFTVSPSLDSISPTIVVTAPAHNAQLNSLPAISGGPGSAQDLGGSGLAPIVGLTINHGSDYWNGTAWTNTQVSVFANIAADGSWAYTSMPTGPNLRSGVYAISATTFDFAGNLSQPVAGVSNRIVVLDLSLPNVSITSPANLQDLPSGTYTFAGTATDNFDIGGVVCYLRRSFDNWYWDGTTWSPSATALSTSLAGSNWSVTTLLPDVGITLFNGSYNFIAIAVDTAGNQRQTDSTVTVNYSVPSRLAASHVDFSNANAAANGTVGTNGWRYGYYPNTGTTGPFSTENMTPANPSYPDGLYPSWRGSLNGNSTPVHTSQEMHPGHPNAYTVVRRYSLNPGGTQNNGEPFHSGPIRVVGRFYDMNPVGATDGFISVNGGVLIGPARIGGTGGTLQAGSRREGGQIAFDFTVNGPLAPGSTFDFGVTTAGDDGSADATGFVAWLMTDDTPVPTNIVANTYHSGNVPYPNNPDGRGDAFVLTTDGRIGATNADCFDTYPAPGHPNQFAGLLYLEQGNSGRATLFESVRLDIGRQFVDGGDFGATPRLFLLRHNSDPNTSDPTTDERYVEMPVVPVKLTNAAGRPYYTFDLGGISPENKTGYGFAVVGPGSSTGRFISVAEISAEATRVFATDVPAVVPKFWEFQGHRYALTTTRGTWQDCENEAVALGGHLVAIGSKEENEWLVNTFGLEQLFIGLKRTPAGGGFQWVSGEPLAFTSWKSGQPNNTSQDYVTINCEGDFGQWYDVLISGFPTTSNYRGIIELPTPGPAASGHRLTVAGRSTVFGAGHNPAQIFPAPVEPPPVAAPASGSIPPTYVRLTGSGSRKIVFSSVGGSVATGADTVGPDGGRHPSNPSRLCDIQPVSPANGISGYRNLDNVPAMVGVFLGDARPSGAPPATLDFSTAALGQDFTELMPQLGQVFFIGDGRRTNGALQEFIVPEGATRLFLGFPDAYAGNDTLIYTGVPNAYGDNSGSFVANLSVIPDPTPRITNSEPPQLGQKFSVIGGTGPYTWSIADGDLPPHLTLLPDGTLSASGQPVVNGNYTFTVRVTDSAVPAVSSTKEFSMSVLAPVEHPDGIVAWWPAQNAAGDVIGDFHGIRRNGAGYADGKSGRTFSFDGVNDLIEVPHVAGLDLPGALTIEGWILRNSGSTIIGKRSADNANVAYVFFVQADGRLAFSSRSGGGAFSEVSTTAPAVMAGVWHHVAVTIGGNEARFYVDGTMVSAASYTASRPAVSAPATIGATVTSANPIGSPVGAFNGRIDELSLYNRALSATEIAAIASASTAGKVRHDLALDFSPTVNDPPPFAPNLPWMYGSMNPDVTPVPATFARFTAKGTHPTTLSWQQPTADPAVISRNYAATNYTNGTISILPTQVSMHPSISGHFSVARWIAPAAGTYKVSASFSRTDSQSDPRQKTVHIFRNADSLFSGTISNPTDERNVTLTVSVALDDTVDFIVGFGNDGYYYDSTGVAASIVAVDAILPPPTVTTADAQTISSTSASLAAIVNPNGFATELRFRYGTDPTLAVFTETTPFSIGSTGPSYSTQGVSGLSPHTRYYYRAVAQSSAGTSQGAILSFLTANTGPSAQADRFAVLNEPAGQAFVLDVRANDSDPDGDVLTVSQVVAPAHGTATIGAGGVNITYRPVAGFVGTDSFSYTVLDGAGGSATATVTVDVQRSFATWAAAEGLGSGENGPGDDVDDDGIDNLFEFFHGMDPNGGSGDRSGLPMAETVPGTNGPAFLYYTYRRSVRAAFSSVEHQLGTSLEAGDWTTTAPVETTVLATDTVNGTQTIRVKLPVPPGSESLFVRLKITL